MTDRELLELAAKADGRTIEFFNSSGTPMLRQPGGGPESCLCTAWNPLTDHFAAERLRHGLGIRVEFQSYNGDDYACATPPGTHQGYDELIADSSTEAGMLAADRAIVRAAAEIGRSMP